MKNTKKINKRNPYFKRRMAMKYIDHILEMKDEWFLVNGYELRTMASVIRQELFRRPNYRKLQDVA